MGGGGGGGGGVRDEAMILREVKGNDGTKIPSSVKKKKRKSYSILELQLSHLLRDIIISVSITNKSS